jgi:HlyD family secretion protein
MKNKGMIFILAGIGIISSVWAIRRGMAPVAKAPLFVEPAQKPYPKALAASGIIEAKGENIPVGSPNSGVVQDVFVKVQDQVRKGDPLFTLDTRELAADLKVAQAKEEVARAEHLRMQDQLSRLQSVKDRRATSEEELRSKEHECAIKAATVVQMQKESEKIVSLLDRLIVRAPMDGLILQKNIQAGQYVVASNIDTPPVVIGDTRSLQIRTDIDEHNAPTIDSQSKAIAYLKNKPEYPIDLKFHRIEPLVVPKMSLTGSSKEKVDTRVLQVIYTFDPPKDLSMYVGQQVDVFIQRGTSP